MLLFLSLQTNIKIVVEVEAIKGADFIKPERHLSLACLFIQPRKY